MRNPIIGAKQRKRRLAESVDALLAGGTVHHAHAGAIPYLRVGTVDEIVAHVVRCRERWEITYFLVRDLDAFVPIIDAL